jgi:HPt (histidine-containing phosphotransfer) domain-containing protein
VDIVLKAKDWIETVVQSIVDPSSMPRPASNVSPSETTPAAPTLSLPDPNSVDTSNVAEEFWADYLATTSAKLDELQDVLEELRGGIDYDANRQNVIRILNFLKGEGGMIGLGKIQKVLQQAENIFRDSVIVEDAVETVFRALEWVAHVLEIAQNRSPSKT